MRILRGYYRLLVIAMTLYLKSEVYAHNTEEVDEPEKDTTTIPPVQDGIGASIFVHPEASDLHSKNSDAEVKVLLRSQGTWNHDPHAEGLVRASSILMEYEEDTRKYLMTEGKGRNRYHRMRHKSRKHPLPNTLSNDYFAANDAPLTDLNDQEASSTAKPKTRPPLRSLQYSHPNRRKVFSSSLKNRGNGTWIALHSPVRIYIPVRLHDKKSTISVVDKCIHCADNITLVAPRGKTDVEVPPPAISICHRLAQEKGRINVAVTVGPRPGVRVTEGHYPVELIVWKPGGHIYSCHYSLDVVVKRCKEVFSPEKGSVNCSQGSLWGSHCKFSCDTNYVLQGSPSIICEKQSGKLQWSSRFPVCKKTASKSVPSIKHIPCLKPHSPSDGTVVCDSNGPDVYPHGSVCQFFCYPGFLIENLHTSSALVVCKNGKWTPNNKARCLATYCSEPKTMSYGFARCDKDMKVAANKAKYKNGTTCTYQCDSGFVIPRSEEPFNRIICNAPHWNDSIIPECKQIIVPLAHTKDCQNVTKIANRHGFVKIKPPRFYLKEFSTSKKSLMYGKCNNTKKLKIGFYVNHCTAYNYELNATGSCTYSITVKENSCSPLPKVPHATITCNNEGKRSFPRRTICNYTCESGFIIPAKQKRFRRKTCIPKKLIWSPSGIPSCKKAVPPSPKKQSCISQRLFLNSNVTSVKLKLPRFKSALKGGKVRVRCLLSGTLPVGNFTNKCEAKDKELGTSSSCEYNITVQARGCTSLPNIPFGSLSCSTIEANGFLPIGSVCNYECDEGHVIPTSLLQYASKTCIGHELWNTSINPSCISTILPTPDLNSCLNSTIEVEVFPFEVFIPNFKSPFGEIIYVNCNPKHVTSYGVFDINCTAYDRELRVSNSCLFSLEVQRYKEFPIKENSCYDLGEIKNGVVECQYNKSGMFAPGTLCEVICNEDFLVPQSERNSSFALCSLSGKWNVSYLPDCIKNEAPILTSGCTDTTISDLQLPFLNVPLPAFSTSQNESANVSCSPDIIHSYGGHEINCSAFDEDLNATSSCSFVLTLEVDDVEDPSTDTPSTTLLNVVSSTTTREPFKPCGQITVPNRGFINCSTEKPVTQCSVGCIDGYGFSLKYETLLKGSIECDGTDGLWDYQRAHNTTKLPECLGHLPNTSVHVWLSFNASTSNCDSSNEDSLKDTIKLSLININKQDCQVVDCNSNFYIGCSEDLMQNNSIINVNWTLQMAFIPPGPNEFPDYEKFMETILTTTQNAIKSNSKWREDLSLDDIHVNMHSYKRGYFVLECDEDGYAVDEESSACVECPPGSFEIGNICVPCPNGQLQLKAGQTSCELRSDLILHSRTISAV